MQADTALIQVLGAVAYGELKAYEGATAKAQAATDERSRREHRKVAAEELRHHKGFVRRLEALGADPERAMAPYRASLDHYHGRDGDTGIADAVRAYLGEGVADDLLRWLRRVADPDTAAFVDTVLEDEAGHEAMAAAELRRRLGSDPRRRVLAALAALGMVARMADSGRVDLAPFLAFVRLGRPVELVGALVGGQLRRLARAGVIPVPAGMVGAAG